MGIYVFIICKKFEFWKHNTQVTDINFTVLLHLDLFEALLIRNKDIVKYIQCDPFERYSLAETKRKAVKRFVAVAARVAPNNACAQ